VSDQEFFVGYLPQAPPGIARRVRRSVALLLVLGATVAAGFAASQHAFVPSAFEYGTIRTFEGWLTLEPIPALIVQRPGMTADQPQYSRYVLVGSGKHGADRDVAGFAGKKVRLSGTLIYRDDQAMIEVVHGSIQDLPDSASETPAPLEVATRIGSISLVGEIVDSKCNLGVMNPGHGKVHKDCAIRCLSGGIPPAFVTEDFRGAPATLFLTGPDHKRLVKEQFLQSAGRSVRISGTVLKFGDSLFFEIDTGSIQPLP
jgi:hypothetical protein